MENPANEMQIVKKSISLIQCEPCVIRKQGGGGGHPVDYWFNCKFGRRVWSEVKVKLPNPNHLPTPMLIFFP